MRHSFIRIELAALDTSHREGLGVNGSPGIDGVKLTFSRVFLGKHVLFAPPRQKEPLCSQLHHALENEFFKKRLRVGTGKALVNRIPPRKKGSEHLQIKLGGPSISTRHKEASPVRK